MAADGLPSWAFWLFLVRGAVALGLAAALLLSDAGVSRLGSFVAVYWLVGALLTLRWAVRNRRSSGSGLGGIAGLSGLVIAIAALVRHLIHHLVGQGLLIDLLGLSAVAMGLLRLVGAFHDDQVGGDAPRRRYRTIIGTLDLVLGLALLSADDKSAAQIRITLGAWGLLTGTFLVLDAITLRRLARSPTEDTA
jgi:uncharacterized membrane protein HdeD (DUF308 family)